MRSLCKFVLIAILCTLPGMVSGIENADALFSAFKGRLSPRELEEGSYIKNATDFYSLLLENKIDTTSARIVTLTPPNYETDVLHPNMNKLNCPLKKQWPYHSFLLLNGKAFDPNYLENGSVTLDNYLEGFWPGELINGTIKAYSFRLKHITMFLGLTKARKPKLLEMSHFNLKELLANPLLLSKPKGK